MAKITTDSKGAKPISGKRVKAMDSSLISLYSTPMESIPTEHTEESLWELTEAMKA